VAAGAVKRVNGYKAAQVGLGWGKLLPAQVVIGLSGEGLGFVEYLILKPQPLVESFSLKTIWLPALILLVFTGFLEELIFRGLMQRASVNTLKKYGPVYISLLFAVLHIGYKSWVDLAFVFLVGFAFSIVVERTRSLVGVTVAHGLTNISLFLVFPFVVGAQLSLPDILPPPSEQILGPAIWSGSLELEPRPTRTPLMMVTDTPTLPAPTETLVASPLPELTATPVPTNLPTNLPTNTPTRAPTSTPVPSKTATAAVVPLASATASPTSTLSPTITLSPTATATLPPTATATETLIPTDILPVEPTDTPIPEAPIVSP